MRSSRTAVSAAKPGRVGLAHFRADGDRPGPRDPRPSMSFGKRRPKLPGPSCGPPTRSPSSKDAWPGSATGCAAWPWSASRPGHRRDRPRLRAAVHLPARPAARPRGPRQRQGVPAPQPDQDQQRAAGGRRPGPAVDGQRPGADPRPGRAARRPDRRDRQGRSASTTLHENRPDDLEAQRRRRSPSSRRPPTRPSGATPARADRRGVRAAASATACSGPTPCRRNEESSRTLSVRTLGRAAGRRARLVPRERVVPERIAKPEGPVYQEFVRRLHVPADRPGPVPPDRRQARRHADPDLRGARPPPGCARRPGTASPTTTTPTAAATCSSSRARRSARSSSSCSGWSTTRPSGALGFGDRAAARRRDRRAGRRPVRPDRLLRRRGTRPPDRARPAPDRRALRAGRAGARPWSACWPCSPGTPS